MDEGKPTKSWSSHASGVLSVSYAHTDLLVTCGRDNQVTLWDGNGKKCAIWKNAATCPYAPASVPTASGFSPRTLAFA